MSEKQLRGKVTIDSDVNGLHKITASTKQVEKNIRQLNTEGKSLDSMLKEAGASSEVLDSAFSSLNLKAADAEEQIRALNSRLKEYDPDSSEYAYLAQALGTMDEEAAALRATYDKLNKELEENENLTDAQRQGLEYVSEQLQDEYKVLTKTDLALEKLNDELRKFEDEAKDAGDAVNKTDSEVKQTATTFKTLEDSIREAEAVWKKHNATTIQLKATYKRWRREGSQTSETMENLSHKIEAAQKAEMGTITTTRMLVTQHNKLNGVVDEASGDYGRLSLSLQNAEGHINGMTNAVRVSHNDSKKLTSSVREVGDEVKGLGATFRDAVSQINVSLKPEALLIGAATAGFTALVDMARNAARAVIEFVKDSTRAYSEFDDGMRQSLTMVDDFSGAMKDQLRMEAIDTGAAIGRLPEEYLPALYQALSLGIPEDNALTAVTEASIAARASNAELTGTLVTGQSIVNAYGAEVYDLSRVYDLLFFAVKNGAVTIDELNSGMNEITSVAGEANVSLEDVVAAVVVMTKQGDSFGEAAGLMSNMLTQLQIEGTAMGGAFRQAAGVDFRTFIAQGGNLAEALQLIENHAISTGSSIVEMVGGDSPFFRDQQAMRGAMELTGKHLEEFIEISDKATESNGLVAAANAEVADSMAVATATTAAQTEAMKIHIGEALEPAARSWLKIKTILAEGTGSLFKPINDDYGDSIKYIVEQQLAAAESSEDLIAMNLRLAEAYGNGQFLNLFDITGTGDEIMRAMQGIVVSQLEVTGSEEEMARQGQVVYEQLHAIYGESVTLKNGYIRLNGEMVGYVNMLYATAIAEKEKLSQGNESNLLLQRQAKYNKDIADALARQAAEARSADKFLNQYQETASNMVDVLEVLDGDTVRIELEGEIKDVRFRNLNTPEIKHGEDAAMPWAYEAMDATQAYFDENPLNLQGQMDRESYDRIIAEVPELERQLVASGLAIPLPVHMTEDPQTFAELEQLTMKAAAAGVGMFEDQALAARVLGGEMVDLGVYYEELAIHQQKLNAYYDDAAGPVSNLFAAYEALANAPAWGIEEAKDAVIAGNDAIVASYRETAYEIYLAQNGVTEGTVAMGVAMGIFTTAEGAKRLEFANTSLAIEELIIAQDNLELTDWQLIEATELLIDGLARTPAQAANAVKGMEDLDISAASAKEETRLLHQALIDAEGSYSATFTTTNDTYNNTYNTTHDQYQPGTADPNRMGGETMSTGGRLQAGSPYIVGDAPGGKLTPYSELFIPDQSGYLLDAQATAALVGNSEGRGSTTTSTAPQGSGSGDTYVFQITIEGNRNDLDHVTAAAERGILSAAAQIGLQL